MPSPALLRQLTALLLVLLTIPAPAAEPPGKLVFGAPVTHSDWMLRAGAGWGPAGVRKMFDACKAAGLTRIYWRALDGGRGLYHSKFVDPQGKWEDASFWDSATDADRKLMEATYGQSVSRI